MRPRLSFRLTMCRARFAVPCAVLALFLMPSAVNAGAWPQPKNKLQLISTFTFTEASSHYGPNGDEVDYGRFEKHEWRLYGEYGWRDSTTFVGEAALAHDVSDSAGRLTVNRGWKELKAGAQIRLFEVSQRRMVMGVRPLAIFHLARESDDPTASEGADMDLRLDVTLGRGADPQAPLKLFYDLAIGYVWRAGERLDEMRLDATVGGYLTPKLMALVHSRIELSNPAESAYEDGYERRKLDLDLVREMSPALSFAVGGTWTYDGRNTAAERGVNLALWYRF